MKKIILAKPNVLPLKSSIITSNGDTEAYQQRKSMDFHYKEIFRALFALPDKDVQKRVLDAINGTPCLKCTDRRTRFVDTATQTDNSIDTNTTLPIVVLNKTDEFLNKSLKTEAAPETTNVKEEPKRRRRRKVCLPQVIKRSHAEMQLQKLPLLPNNKKRKVETNDNKPANVTETKNMQLMGKLRDKRHISISSEYLFDTLSEYNFFEQNTTDHIVKQMANEMIEAEIVQNGLLPIHDAILKNDRNALKRQIYVWKKIKKVDLNELITDEDEDCLQLSIVNDCYPRIIDELLNSGLNVNCVDGASNTAIHLAILNEVELQSLEMLMERIDLENLLLINNDGFTPLQLAVRNDHYLHAEIILNSIDSRLNGSMMYKCDSTRAKSRSTFQDFYEKICNHMQVRDFANATKTQLKRKLLAIGDARSGTTPLLFAVEKNLEHFVYFLLAHLADPRIQNHSGTNARSYLCEFGKVLGLSFKIDKIMEKVECILDNSKCKIKKKRG